MAYHKETKTETKDGKTYTTTKTTYSSSSGLPSDLFGDFEKHFANLTSGTFNSNISNSNRVTYKKYEKPETHLPDGYSLYVKPAQEVDYVKSECTGQKKAVLVGINYIGSKFELKGCINDVHNIKKFLIEHYSFKEKDMTILTDDQLDPSKIPTRQNILNAMKGLVANPKPDDSFFFHFSGHGGQMMDDNNDEEDGFDETIMPLDFQTNGQIIDDEMHHILVDNLPAGARLTVVFDSCHSGTVLDLPYVYSTRGTIKKPKVLVDGAKSAIDAGMKYLHGDLQGIKDSFKSFTTKTLSGQRIRRKNIETKSSTADVIMFSGCKDEQTSADASEGGSPTGAMSYALIKSLSVNDRQTYHSLLNNIRDILRNKYAQKPQLSASHPMDMHEVFKM